MNFLKILYSELYNQEYKKIKKGAAEKVKKIMK